MSESDILDMLTAPDEPPASAEGSRPVLIVHRRGETPEEHEQFERDYLSAKFGGPDYPTPFFSREDHEWPEPLSPFDLKRLARLGLDEPTWRQMSHRPPKGT